MNKYMKILLCYGLLLCSFFLFFSKDSASVRGASLSSDRTTLLAASLSGQVLRFHILADSDETSAQEIKLLVRDAVLTYLHSEAVSLSEAASAKEAEAILTPLLPSIKEVIDGTLSSLSAPYSSSVRLTTRFFPIKQYGSLMLPPGDYRALEITLGSGAGRNWWCMLYPSLCFTEGITGTLPEEEQEELRGLLSEEEFELLFTKKKKPVFRFKLGKIFKKLFGKR